MFELECLTAPALRRLIADGVDTVVVPVGSIEDHGAHLPVGADAVLADHVGGEVARRLHALLAPTVRVGHAVEHGPILSVRDHTLADVAVDIAVTLVRQRVHTIAFVSTHGGNAQPLAVAVDRARELLPRAVVHVPVGDVGPQPGSYSGLWLTSALLAVRPDLVDVEAADSSLAAELHAASAERGLELLECFVGSVVDQLSAV